ncbi:MAG TPA: hypothetical protein VFS21_07275 [Roseiflexaceae bacterium]|nr:hypothetical protein [Roseiflexaceae bacterium]
MFHLGDPVTIRNGPHAGLGGTVRVVGTEECLVGLGSRFFIVPTADLALDAGEALRVALRLLEQNNVDTAIVAFLARSLES